MTTPPKKTETTAPHKLGAVLVITSTVTQAKLWRNTIDEARQLAEQLNAERERLKIKAVRLYVAAEVTEDVNDELIELAQIATAEAEAAAEQTQRRPLLRMPAPREITRPGTKIATGLREPKPDRAVIPPPKQVIPPPKQVIPPPKRVIPPPKRVIPPPKPSRSRPRSSR